MEVRTLPRVFWSLALVIFATSFTADGAEPPKKETTKSDAKEKKKPEVKPKASKVKAAKVKPKAAPKATISLSGASLTTEKTNVICWMKPRRVRRKDFGRFKKAFEIAAKSTEPKHISYEIVRIKSVSKEAEKRGCQAVADVTVKGRRKATVIVETTEIGAPQPITTTTFQTNIKEITEKDFEPAWLKIWKYIAPPPPPPPPKPDRPFVDKELVKEQELAKVVPVEEPTGSLITAHLAIGFVSRSVDNAPGAPLERANLLAFGGEVTLHTDSFLGLWRNHDIDIEAGYNHRLAVAERTDQKFNVTADRINATALYRYHLGALLPRIGAYAGYELLRFEIGATANAFSVRYSSVRGGLTVVHPFIDDDTMVLAARLDGGLLLSPSSDGGDALLGFDLRGGPFLRHASGFLVGISGRFAQHGGTILESDFTDGYIDVEVNVGWSQ